MKLDVVSISSHNIACMYLWLHVLDRKMKHKWLEIHILISLFCKCHYKKVVFSLKIEKRKRTKKVQLVFPSLTPLASLILLNPLFNAVLWFMKWTSPLLPFTQKRRTTKLQLHYTAIVTHTDYWRLKSPFKIERIEEKIHKEKSSIIFTN